MLISTDDHVVVYFEYTEAERKLNLHVDHDWDEPDADKFLLQLAGCEEVCIHPAGTHGWVRFAKNRRTKKFLRELVVKTLDKYRAFIVERRKQKALERQAQEVGEILSTIETSDSKTDKAV